MGWSVGILDDAAWAAGAVGLLWKRKWGSFLLIGANCLWFLIAGVSATKQLGGSPETGLGERVCAFLWIVSQQGLYVGFMVAYLASDEVLGAFGGTGAGVVVRSHPGRLPLHARLFALSVFAAGALLASPLLSSCTMVGTSELASRLRETEWLLQATGVVAAGSFAIVGSLALLCQREWSLRVLAGWYIITFVVPVLPTANVVSVYEAIRSSPVIPWEHLWGLAAAAVNLVFMVSYLRAPVLKRAMRTRPSRITPY